MPFLTQSTFVLLMSSTLVPAPQVMTLLTQLSNVLRLMALSVPGMVKLLMHLSSKSPA